MKNELKRQKSDPLHSKAHVKKCDKVFGTQQCKRQVRRPNGFIFIGLFSPFLAPIIRGSSTKC